MAKNRKAIKWIKQQAALGKKIIKVDYFSKKFSNATISAKNYSHSSEKEKIRTQH